MASQCNPYPQQVPVSEEQKGNKKKKRKNENRWLSRENKRKEKKRNKRRKTSHEAEVQISLFTTSEHILDQVGTQHRPHLGDGP